MAFGLKTVALSITVFGGGLGCVRHYLDLKQRRQQLSVELDRAGGGVIDPEGAPDTILSMAAPGTLQRPSEQFPISRLRRFLGDDSAYCIIIWNGTLSRSKDREIVEAFPEAIIWRVDPSEDTPAFLAWLKMILRIFLKILMTNDPRLQAAPVE